MRIFKVTYEIVTPESAEQGDCEERGRLDDVSCAPDMSDIEDGITAVDLAVTLLKGEGATQPSTSGAMTTDSWWTNYEYDTDYRTGAVESRSYHPYGWTVEELNQINQRVKS